ncbi:MAG: CDP-2,3-bis-(O-geranylgeranyl)-sn-glycerol synthase [Candidatus Aenigmarchaeota archaeon]|nr:CDP-2,3-bis-(O-geranylgeranyl)-sn-glycerol synthase [Candidatus Aenigmarchaeota archaeon]
MFSLILQSLWFIAPAYIANASPVLLKGKRPLDFGRRLGKNRLLGDGKTWEGTFGGIAIGTLFGLAQIYAQDYLPANLNLVKLNLTLVLLLSAGALIGDVGGSFIKRRFGIPRGQHFPLFDQLTFLIAALIISSPAYRPEISMIILLFIMTPVVHWATNNVAYILKLKKHPW